MVQNNSNKIPDYVYACPFTYVYLYLNVCKINDSNITIGRRQELGFYYYNVFWLLWSTIMLFKSVFGLLVNCIANFRVAIKNNEKCTI